MKTYLSALVIFFLAGCATQEQAPEVRPVSFKILEPLDEQHTGGRLVGDFPNAQTAKLFLCYHSPGSVVIAIYPYKQPRKEEPQPLDADSYMLPPYNQCYRMSNGRVCHSLARDTMEAECHCGMKDEPVDDGFSTPQH